MNRFAPCAMLTLCLLAAGISQAMAHSADEHAGHDMPAKSATSESAQVKFADVALVDQTGKAVRLEQDLVSNKIVVMSFIYTSCTTVCPVVSSIMGKVQKQLGARVGTEVQLVSISIDPQRDDAKRLNEYARSFQNGPGWSWLTGSTQSVAETLKGLGTFNGDLKSHAPLILVGDGNSRHWTRYYGFTDPAVLTREVEKLSGERNAHAKHTAIAMEQHP
ncbi:MULTISPECIES: SCO family protein [unclassified Pseudomonas]|jgi:protein SCO1/2|uniref:SCO family protein n=1 Tax=unclassified Pseudomonas TaxID=196821 RepID=UPI000F095EA7|nr:MULTISPECIES: SCO family protein [unclassified Pseudomonas]MCA4960907.1 SCO family protein [Pseudomonas sp. Y24-6]MCH4879966.1 SCO family protein [Pseudomonas sp. TMW22090]